MTKGTRTLANDMFSFADKLEGESKKQVQQFALRLEAELDSVFQERQEKCNEVVRALGEFYESRFETLSNEAKYKIRSFTNRAARALAANKVWQGTYDDALQFISNLID